MQPDDSRHPLLSRRLPVGQTSLTDDGAPRASYGGVAIQDLSARSGLTPLTMPGEDGWSVNPYAGCLHACTYCYVPDTLRAERGAWGGYVAVKWNLPTLLAHDLRRRPCKTVYLSTATDPYQPVEAEHRITRACLEVLARHDWPVRILTRSPLVARDVDVLRRFSDLRVGLSIPTLDDGVRAAVEPAAPPIAARLAALQHLADAGLDTYANYCPAMPMTGDVTPALVAQAFRKAGVRSVRASAWHYVDSFLPALRARLHGTPYEDIADYAADAPRQQRLLRALTLAFQREGLTIDEGMSSPKSLDTNLISASRVETPQAVLAG